MKTIILSSEQQAYLVSKLGKDTAGQFVTACGVGLHDLLRPVVEPKLGAADWAAIVSLAKDQGSASGFPTGNLAVVGGISAASERIASALTQRDRGGNPIPGRPKHPGIAREFLDGTFSWPAVDAFGRAFPTPEALAALPKADVSKRITGSGFPKCHMDGILYYQQRTGGTEQVLHGGTVAVGGWRGYNQQRGTGARYWLPEHHPLVAPVMLGDKAKEYEALIEANKQAKVAEGALPAASKARKPRAAKV